MSRRSTAWPAGTPCWVDLSAADLESAQRAYAATLGWAYDPPSETYGGYATARVDGAVASGVAPVMQGASPAWTVYLASDDADATAAAIAAHGGTVLVGPMDVAPFGRMLIALDPQGAAFGVWQHGEMIGTQVVNEPGGLIWEQLAVPDPQAAQAFYGGVFGWSFSPMPGAPDDGHVTFHPAPGEPPMGGINPHTDGTPAHWLPYFAVVDADAAVAAATAGGGTLVGEPLDSPWGRMATLRDAEGATYAVMGTDGSAAPDRTG